MLSRPDRTLRWDVLELHLSEAAYLWTQREAALVSAEYALAEVEEGPERRLLTQVDALAVGGPRTRDRLLVPALASDEAEERGAAAFATAFSGDAKDVGLVADTAAEAAPKDRPPLLRALALTPAPSAAPALASLAGAADPDLAAGALDALAFRRAVTQEDVARLISRREPRVAAAAVRALRFVPGGPQAGAVRVALGAQEPELRHAALVIGAVGGLREVARVARDARAAAGPLGETARLLLATLGGDDDARALVELLDDEDLRRDALFALGFSGRLLAVEAALRWVDDDEVGGVAAEAVSAITGIAITDALVRAPPPGDGEDDELETDDDELPALEEDLGSELLPGADEELPLVEAGALAKRWEELRPKLPADQRLLRGRPSDLGVLLAELEAGPARRRPVLALELAVRSKGAVQVEPFALVPVQREQLAAARGLRSGTAFTAPVFPRE